MLPRWKWAVSVSADPVRLLVSGEGLIRGRLADSSGSPSAGVEVRAIADLHGHGAGASGALNRERWLEQLRTTGHLRTAAITDSDGRFVLSGLAASTWFTLSAKASSTSLKSCQVLGRASSGQGAPPLEAIHRRAHLVVDLTDAGGHSLARPESDQPLPARRLEQPVVLVYECLDGVGEGGGIVTGGRPIRPVRFRNSGSSVSIGGIEPQSVRPRPSLP